MIYATCPTCGFLLASKANEYEEKKKEICDNPNLNIEEQEIKIQELIYSLGIRRYCCKMRLMTCKDIVQDVTPVNNDIK
jgi:DNA-directed RNA polymerase subunit N (RpoN/RPB10)